MNQTAVVIFVKTPGLSPVKTRLAKGIGEVAAQKIYNEFINILSHELSLLDKNEFKVYWAVNEGEQGFHYWDNFSCIAQEGEGLGEKQWNIQEKLYNSFNNLIFIGADCPDLKILDIKKTVELLEENDFIFGPAIDGGYYLFGSNRRLPKNIWKNIEYSQANTLISFRNKLNKFKISMLEEKRDIDTIEDLNLVQSSKLLVNISQESLSF